MKEKKKAEENKYNKFRRRNGGTELSTVVLEDRIFRDSTYKSRQTKV